MTQTTIHGTKAAHTSAWVGLGFAAPGVAAAESVAGTATAESSRLRSLGESQSSFGCHTCRKPIRQAIEMSEAPISTIQGLMKFDIRNCGIANVTPHTRIAGHTCIM